MNANIFLGSCAYRRLYFWASLSLVTTALSAQTPTTPRAIRGAKTDNSYSNTTEISKAKNATDEQVLSQIEGNYGLGDVVRIVITTPKPTTEPLGRSTNGKPSTINVSPVPIPMGQLTPNNNLSIPQQGKSDDYAQPKKSDDYNLRNGAKPTKSDDYVQPTKSDDYNLRNGAKPTKSDDYTQPKKSDDYNLRNGAKPTKSDDYDLQNGAKSSKSNDYVRPNGSKPYGSDGQFTTPSGNRPTPQQATTPVKYDENGRPIRPKSNYSTTQWTPITNKPAPQQPTTPPQYKSNPQPSMPTVASKTPTGNSSTMTASTDKMDLNSFFEDKKDRTVVSQDIVVTNKSAETPVREQQKERVERKTYTPSGRAERASGGSSGSSRTSKSAKYSGFSLKNLFSFGTSGSKIPKRQPVKSSKKYGCYRFN